MRISPVHYAALSHSFLIVVTIFPDIIHSNLRKFGFLFTFLLHSTVEKLDQPKATPKVNI